MRYTPDISEFVSFKWFQWHWYSDEGSSTKTFCHWIGPAHQVGKSFCYYLILENGEYIARSLVITIPKSNFASIEMKDKLKEFMHYLESRIGHYRKPLYKN